jgi:hypothetical protein
MRLAGLGPSLAIELPRRTGRMLQLLCFEIICGVAHFLTPFTPRYQTHPPGNRFAARGGDPGGASPTPRQTGAAGVAWEVAAGTPALPRVAGVCAARRVLPPAAPDPARRAASPPQTPASNLRAQSGQFRLRPHANWPPGLRPRDGGSNANAPSFRPTCLVLEQSNPDSTLLVAPATPTASSETIGIRFRWAVVIAPFTWLFDGLAAGFRCGPWGALRWRTSLLH